MVTIEVPDPGPGEALVQVQACGVCHTDLHYREGGINDDFPFLLGHEAAGVVEAVGPEVTGLAPGDFVVLNWRAVCGTCRSCLRGRPWYCFSTFNATQKMTLDGQPLSPALGIGAFAEKTLVAAGPVHQGRPGGQARGRRAAGLRGDGRPRRRHAHRRGRAGRHASPCSGAAASATPPSPAPSWPVPRTIVAVDLDPRKLELGQGVRRHPHRRRLQGGPRRGGPGGHRRQRRRRVHRGGRQPEGVRAGVPRPRPRRHARAGRRAHARHAARPPVHRAVRPGWAHQAELVRRLPPEPRLPDAGRPPPPGPAAAREVRVRDDRARRTSRRRSTRWSGARSSARSSSSRASDGEGHLAAAGRRATATIDVVDALPRRSRVEPSVLGLDRQPARRRRRRGALAGAGSAGRGDPRRRGVGVVPQLPGARAWSRRRSPPLGLPGRQLPRRRVARRRLRHHAPRRPADVARRRAVAGCAHRRRHPPTPSRSARRRGSTTGTRCSRRCRAQLQPRTRYVRNQVVRALSPGAPDIGGHRRGGVAVAAARRRPDAVLQRRRRSGRAQAPTSRR